MKDVRDTYGGRYERIHMLTRKDLQNIAKMSDLNSFKRSEDDALSVQLFVNEMSTMKERSPVAYFKPQGVIDELMGKDDFMLVIISEVQKDMFVKFGPEKICIDSTHGTNAYDFYLTTVVVVDEFNCGFPVAFCFSNRLSGNQMEIFFKSIHSKIGNLKPKVFMSDDAPAYYNSWKKIFGESERQLLCAWHVDKNWRQALSKVKGQEKKVAVYKYLRTMLECTDQYNFEKLLENFLKECEEDDDVKNFGIYFKNTYANRCNLWAYCHRLGAGINTNMYLEAFHKVLKHIYMSGKVNKRIDVCLYHLSNLVKDKIFDRHTKLIKGGTSKKSSDIHNRHRNSFEVIKSVHKLQDFEWSVTSSKNNKVMYEVKKIMLEPEHYCELRCRICSTCIHSYTCTCTDCIVRNNMCKHIHAVHMTENPSTSIQTRNESDILNEIESNSAVKELCTSRSENSDISLKNKINLMASLLDANEVTEDTRQKLHKNIDCMLNLIQADMKQNQGKESKEPANKNIQQQTRFYSTKNKRKAKEPMSKPSTSYQHSLVECITNPENSFNDHTYCKHDIK